MAKHLAWTRIRARFWDIRPTRHSPASEQLRDPGDLFMEAGKEAREQGGPEQVGSPVLVMMKCEVARSALDFPRVLVLTVKPVN